ncbi:1894_t:CDS:2 [Funneliformis mosseae]|uniref:1894_t:CDS:1 n=1 Tax=Funneliformis mosseae TaxID=27381 RepID=A0A9N9CSJ9_FUNMO|nr:1894_t:CDS:2 [Funneliformis mosseae]
MTNNYDVIDDNYVQVPKNIIILQDQFAVINNLSKQYTNSRHNFILQKAYLCQRKTIGLLLLVSALNVSALAVM